MEKIPKFNKRGAFNKAVGPGKISKLINVGPTFIPDYRVDYFYFQKTDVKKSEMSSI